MNFTYDYNGSDISGVGGWTFYFNATNDDGVSTQSGFTYTVEEDDINTNYIYPGNEISINRNETTIFSVRSYDRDNQTYPDTSDEAIGKIYLSTVGFDTLFDTPNSISADDGFFNRTVTNSEWCDDAFFLGKHGWYGGTDSGEDDVKNNLTKDNIMKGWMDKFLEAAIDEAKKGLEEGGIPIGSVLVIDNKIVGKGHNRRVQSGSSILHAEMDCFENAGRLKAIDYKKATCSS